MKTYTATAGNGVRYTFAGLIDGVKEDLEDTVQAAERNKLARQFQKKLIDERVYMADRQAVQAMSFDSEPVVKYCTMTRAGQRHLIRLLLEAGGKLKEVAEADVDAVHADYLTEGTEIGAAFLRIWEDAFPKPGTGASAPPTSTAPSGETSGGASSVTSPSTCPTTSAAG